MQFLQSRAAPDTKDRQELVASQKTNLEKKLDNLLFPQGVKNFERIVSNVGAQLRLPKEDIEGLKLCAAGGRRWEGTIVKALRFISLLQFGVKFTRSTYPCALFDL